MTEKAASTNRQGRWVNGARVAALGLLCLWAYWTTLGEMARRWLDDPQYSHGYLVPVFAAYLLWSRRDRLGGAAWQPSWWGLGLVLLAAVVRLAAARVAFGW